MWLDRQPESTLKSWLRRTNAPMLASGPDGEIYWVNRAFEELTGYTSAELIGKITWQKLSESDDDLEADKLLVSECLSNERSSYRLQKQYRTKSGPPIRVIIDVLRHPPQGDFEVFLVTAIPINNGYEFAMGKIATMHEVLIQLVEQSDRAARLAESKVGISDIKNAFASNPYISTLVTLIISGLVFGDRAISTFKAISELIK